MKPLDFWVSMILSYPMFCLCSHNYHYSIDPTPCQIQIASLAARRQFPAPFTLSAHTGLKNHQILIPRLSSDVVHENRVVNVVQDQPIPHRWQPSMSSVEV